jgi:selenocysteine-specific elongation factor
MRKLILGTAGHIDHGKTALVRALTGIDTDRLPEEKRRGITIDLGFANLTLPSGDEIGIVDVPGHEAFVRNMLAGASGVDLALLVVAADESVMPQTREHLAILELLGVRAGVIALTKVDLVNTDWLELATEEVRDTVSLGPLADAPILPVSARTGSGIPELLSAIGDAAAAVALRDEHDLFRLPVDRVFTVRGTGTVVTGTVWSGTLEREQTIRQLPAHRTVRVRALQAFGHDRAAVRAGERAAIALAGLTRADIQRGDTLAIGEGWQSTSMLTVALRVLPDAPRPLAARQRVRFHLGTAEVLGRVVLFDREELSPGEHGWGQLRLEAAVVARAGDRFVIRSYSPVTTIAGGVVVEPSPPKRKRLTPADREHLELVLGGAPSKAVEATVLAAGWHGVPSTRLPMLTPLAPRQVPQILAGSACFLDLDGLIFHAELGAACRERLREAVNARHQADPLSAGATIDELRRSVPTGTASSLFDWALNSLAQEGWLVVEGANVRRADFSSRLTVDQESIVSRVLGAFRAAGLAPPSLAELPADIATRADLERLLRYLERQRELVQIAPGQWIDRSTVLDAAERARTSFGDRGITPGDFKELYGVSRKYLIPLLEYFDRIGITVRRGDLRELTATSEIPVSTSP